MAGESTRPFFALTVVFGAGAIAFVVWFGGVIPNRTCTGPLPAGTSALLAFQLSRTAADIEAVFGPEGDPCRADMIAAMDRANRVDLIGFIATYNAFLALFFLAMLRAGSGNAARVGLAAVVATLLFDVLETATQLHITSSLPGSGTSLLLLTIGSRGKFLSLGVACVAAGAAMIARGRALGRVAGVGCAAGGAMIIVAIGYHPARPMLTAGSTVALPLILLYAGAAAVRGR